MPWSFFVLVGFVLALALRLLSKRLGRSGRYQPRAIVFELEAGVPEIVASNLESEARGHRAMALMCASVCWRGDPTDTEGLLSVADEFLQYIQGDNAVMPRPDKLCKGKMPKGGR